MKISVIIASYNYAQYLDETISSVINQSYQDWELIVVDDGSRDNSVEIIKSYCEKDSRIKLFQHDGGQNRGLKETLLLGIEHATGDWIAFLESDDTFEIDNLLKKAEIVENFPDIKLVFNKVKFIQEGKGKRLQQKIFKQNQKKLAQMNFPRNMFKELNIDNLLLTFSCVMVEAETLKNTSFDTPSDAILDWWLWVHIAYKNEFYYIDEELTNWRLHTESYVNASKKPALCFTQIEAYKDVCKQNDKPFGLPLFILHSQIKYFCVRLVRFCLKIVGRINS